MLIGQVGLPQNPRAALHLAVQTAKHIWGWLRYSQKEIKAKKKEGKGGERAKPEGFSLRALTPLIRQSSLMAGALCSAGVWGDPRGSPRIPVRTGSFQKLRSPQRRAQMGGRELRLPEAALKVFSAAAAAARPSLLGMPRIPGGRSGQLQGPRAFLGLGGNKPHPTVTQRHAERLPA